MHAAQDLSWVFTKIPRTASHSLTKWLEENFSAERIGPYHSTQVPDGVPLRFCVVRNPVERAKSLYRWVKTWETNFGRELAALSFAEFVARLPRTRAEGPHGALGSLLPQAVCVAEAKATLQLPFEDLPGALYELPFVTAEDHVGDFPHENALPDEARIDVHVDDDILAAILEWDPVGPVGRPPAE